MGITVDENNHTAALRCGQLLLPFNASSVEKDPTVRMDGAVISKYS